MDVKAISPLSDKYFLSTRMSHKLIPNYMLSFSINKAGNALIIVFDIHFHYYT